MTQALYAHMNNKILRSRRKGISEQNIIKNKGIESIVVVVIITLPKKETSRTRLLQHLTLPNI
jgi:uncharacterized membrane protein YvbJ